METLANGNVGGFVQLCCILTAPSDGNVGPMETLVGLYIYCMLYVISFQARSFGKTCLHCIPCRNVATILVAKKQLIEGFNVVQH
jgi:hypothetical protein